MLLLNLSYDEQFLVIQPALTDKIINGNTVKVPTILLMQCIYFVAAGFLDSKIKIHREIRMIFSNDMHPGVIDLVINVVFRYVSFSL